MAKKSVRAAVKRTSRSVSFDEMDVRRFCIEMAQRWPTIVERSGLGGGMAQYGNGSETVRDADVIGRADKIYTWLIRE